MNYFRVTISLSGPTGGTNTWQADTIFGHLCWALRYASDESELRRFLRRYDEAEKSERSIEPPLVLSNGFPSTLLPKPMSLDQRHIMSSEDVGEQREFDRGKDIRKWQYLTVQEFESIRRGESILYDTNVNRRFGDTRVTLKNQINRMTNTTDAEGGQLFPFEWTHVPEVTVYCGVADGEEQLARSLFRSLETTGYGKRKSVGYGAISGVEFDKTDLFNDIAGANAAMSMSNFVPSRDDPTEGWWTTLVKYGKLGEEYARHPNPFKRPVLMLTAGSVLRDDPPKPFYGRMVKEVAPDVSENIVHYGYALSAPIIAPNE